jgi:hypothetical protein
LVIAAGSANVTFMNLCGTFVCEQTTNFYYASGATTAYLAVSGYEDN